MRVQKLTSLFLVVLSVGAVCSCASTVAKIFPVGEPVTAERCQALDLKDLGYKDGSEGQRSGPRFDFWSPDCRAFGVKLDRALYEGGYADGITNYCSCEKGFAAGVRNELNEFRGQYYICKRVDYARFIKGHAAGLDFKSDAAYVNVKGVHSFYNDEAITQKGQAICAALPADASANFPYQD